MKVSILALFAAPVLVLGSLAPQSGPAAVAHHHHNVARGVKAHPASHYHGKRGPAKAKRCAAKTASLSSASVSSTSVLAHQTTTTTTKKETTTKKPEEKPTTTTTHHTTTTTPKPKPTADKNDDDNNDDSGNDGGVTGQTYTGDATFYSTGLNACGTYDSDDDFIAAVAHANFDSFPGANGNSNENPICNKKVKACYKGNCVTVRITDRCGGCNWGALDFSPSAFRQLADPDLGRLHGMTWNFI